MPGITQFKSRERNSKYWHNQATNLYKSAGVLWISMNDPQFGALIGASKLSGVATSWPAYQMLCGMSFELLLKAVMVKQGKTAKHTHDLLTLSADAGFTPSSEQRNTLQFLSASVIWEGRYPVPTSEDKYVLHLQLANQALFNEVPGRNLRIFRPNNALDWQSIATLWNAINQRYHTAAMRPL